MSDTTTATTQDPAQQKEALQTDAAELEQDIKEAEQDAKEARKDGNDERADKLEASIAETKKELGEIKTLLKGLTERPFHPAPGDGDTPPTGEKQGETKQEEQRQEQDEPPAEPKRKHWMFGDRWNQE